MWCLCVVIKWFLYDKVDIIFFAQKHDDTRHFWKYFQQNIAPWMEENEQSNDNVYKSAKVDECNYNCDIIPYLLQSLQGKGRAFCENVWSNSTQLIEFQRTQVVTPQCPYLNNSTSTKLCITYFMHWSVSSSGQVGSKIVLYILVSPESV